MGRKSNQFGPLDNRSHINVEGNRPAATDVGQIEGPYRRVRLNAWLGRRL